jgi:luciferase-like monooxygenase
VDVISAGRLDLGLGPGGFDDDVAWLGIPVLTPGGRVERFREAMEVIDRLLRNRRLGDHGTYYHLEEAPLVRHRCSDPVHPWSAPRTASEHCRSSRRMQPSGCRPAEKERPSRNRCTTSGNAIASSTGIARQSTVIQRQWNERTSPGGERKPRFCPPVPSRASSVSTTKRESSASSSCSRVRHDQRTRLLWEPMQAAGCWQRILPQATTVAQGPSSV